MAIAQDGLLRVVSNDQLNAQEQREQAIQDASEVNSAPVLQGLAAHIMKCWESAKSAKSSITDRLLKAQLC